jgi:trehalose 6-phosphate synthase
MNLVAKEYVAAQSPVDPGVLVLSKFAGAADELDTALLVNPHDIDGMARTIAMAVSMPLHERRMRYEAMMVKLHRHSIQQWFADFLESLQDSEVDDTEIEPLPAAPAGFLTPRSAPPGTRYH